MVKKTSLLILNVFNFVMCKKTPKIKLKNAGISIMLD